MRKEGFALFAALAIPPRSPDIFIRGFNLVESEQSLRSLEIHSNNAAHFKEEKLTSLGEVSAQIWRSAKGGKPFKVSGNSGIFHGPSGNLEIRQKSQVVTPDQYTFESEVFFYDGAKKIISSKEKVHARPSNNSKKNANVHLSGVGVEIDIDKRQYLVLSKSEAIQQHKGKAPLIIRSKQAHLQPEKNIVEFLSNVKVKGQDLTMNGDRLIILLGESASNVLAKEMRMNSNKQSIATINGLKIQSKGITTTFNSSGEVSGSKANGAVVAQSADGSIFNADELDTETINGEERITLRGGVNIKSDLKLAKGQIAYYYPSRKEFVVEQGASVVQKDQHVKGERIRFWNESQKVVVEKASGTLNKSTITD